MPMVRLALLQKPQSPLQGLLRQALDQEFGPAAWRDFNQASDDLMDGGPVVVLWDLHGYGSPEIRTICQVLPNPWVGVVVACGVVDDLVRQALREAGALALVAEPTLPIQVAAALEVASSTLERLCELAAEREALERQMVERLVIEQAKRVLMEAGGLGEAEAMRQMQRHSRNTNQKLAAVAQKVVTACNLFNGKDHQE